MYLDPGPPGPARRFHQPAVAGAAVVGYAEALHDLEFVAAGRIGNRWRRLRLDLQVEHLFLFAAEHRENTVRRQPVQRLAEIEIVLEFFAFGFLASSNRGRHPPVRPHLLAQLADQIGVFGEFFHQNGARAVERGCGIGHVLFGIDKARGHDGRIALRLRQQKLGQRFETGLLRDLRLGAALRLERQIDILQPSLAVGGQDGRFQRGIELALFADRIEDGGTARFELAQIGQALFQVSQLCIVEAARDFLAVSRDKGNGGTVVEQRHRRVDLLLAHAELFRDLSIDICHAESFSEPSGAAESPAAGGRLWTIAD